MSSPDLPEIPVPEPPDAGSGVPSGTGAEAPAGLSDQETADAMIGVPAAPVESTEPDVAILTSRGKREHRRAGSIRGHDFRQSGFLAPSEMRRIRQRHEQFVRAIAARLAILLRLEFTVRLAKVRIEGYQKFTERLASPTHVTLFKAEPLKGVGLLVISPRLGLSFVDRLLGGPGELGDAIKDLSEIEITLIDQVAVLLLSEWCNQWPEVPDLHPALLGHENNSRFLQTAPPDTAMLVFTLEAGVGENVEPVELVLPYATMEPLVRLLGPAGMPADNGVPAAVPALRWNQALDDLKVPVTAEWHGLKLAAGEITRLKRGDVLMLDNQNTSQVRIKFSHTPKFLARPGQSSGRWAVQLTGAVRT